MPSSSRPRLKLLLAAGLAALSILLPLSPVWRSGGEEIDALVAERALLDPLARALSLQRSLLGHADVAQRVLRGRGGLETERRLRQHAVEADLVALQATLSAGLWARALGETHALTQDWRELAWQVAHRVIDETRCVRGHQLLVEQAVQVMDLVSSHAPAGSPLQLALLPQPLAAREAAVQARQQAVALRLAALHGSRAEAAAGGVAAALLLMWLLSRVSGSGSPPAGASRDDVRRSHGRRRTDFSGFDPALQWSHVAAEADRRRAADAGPAAAGPGRTRDDDAM